MSTSTEAQEQARKVWGAGDYDAVARLIATAGRRAVSSAEVAGGDVVLDVACGTGNATIPAAEQGARVTGIDITPKLLEEGRAAAAAAGVEVDWVEGDAEQLPFEDASFDVVLSVFGCIFAPDHDAAAREIARVLRPGGRIALCNWMPEGNIGEFFRTVGAHLPPPPDDSLPPTLWGTEEHVRRLFDGTGIALSFDRAAVAFEFASPEEYVTEYETKFGPIVTAKATLEPSAWQALRQDLLRMLERINTSADGLRFDGEYLVVAGRKTG